MATGLTFYNSFIPNEKIQNIFHHLQADEDETNVDTDWVIIQATEVCKAWNENGTLQEEREKAITHLQNNVHHPLKNFPNDLVDIFHRCGLAVSKLPLLSIEGNTEFVDLDEKKPIIPYKATFGIFPSNRYAPFHFVTATSFPWFESGIIIILKRKNPNGEMELKKNRENWTKIFANCSSFSESKILWDVNKEFYKMLGIRDEANRDDCMPHIIEQLLLNQHPHLEIPDHRAGNPRIKLSPLAEPNTHAESKSYKNSALISAVAIAALAFVVGYFYSNDMLI